MTFKYAELQLCICLNSEYHLLFSYSLHTIFVLLYRREKIKGRYYWRGLYKEVATFVITCNKCQRKPDLKKANKSLRSIPVPLEAFNQVGMDLTGPLETMTAGM